MLSARDRSELRGDLRLNIRHPTDVSTCNLQHHLQCDYQHDVQLTLQGNQMNTMAPTRLALQRPLRLSLTVGAEAPAEARWYVRAAIDAWDIPVDPFVAALLTSELVTNAVRYAQGKIGLRLVLEGGLFCEVVDDSAAPPRLRHAVRADPLALPGGAELQPLTRRQRGIPAGVR